MKTKSTQKLITFPNNLLELLEKKAGKYGMKSTEYVRFLVLEDIKNESEYDLNALNKLSKEVEEEMQNGEAIAFKSEREIEDYVNGMV